MWSCLLKLSQDMLHFLSHFCVSDSCINRSSACLLLHATLLANYIPQSVHLFSCKQAFHVSEICGTKNLPEMNFSLYVIPHLPV